MNNFATRKLYLEKQAQSVNVSILLKISLGLILFTVISSALVYAETLSVDVGGTSFDIQYDVTGMTVSGIEADTDFISLIFTVDVTESIGTLNITLDRSFFDTVYKGLDDDFIILAEGDEPTFSETDTTPQSRTLSIDLPAGTEEVEIIGSVFGGSTTTTPPPPPAPEIPDPDKVDADAAAAAAAAKAEADAAAKAEADAAAAAAAKAEADAAAAAAAAAANVDTDNTLSKLCGAGTVLKDGECILDERCGAGTILKDGVCVLDSSFQSTGTSSQGLGRGLATGFIVAFLGAGIIITVLAVISKASK